MLPPALLLLPVVLVATPVLMSAALSPLVRVRFGVRRGPARRFGLGRAAGEERAVVSLRMRGASCERVTRRGGDSSDVAAVAVSTRCAEGGHTT